MTTNTVPAAEDPRRMLAESHRLAHRVRLDQRVTWFPLLVFAVATFAAIPVGRYGPRDVSCQPAGDHTACRIFLQGSTVYWPLALLLSYAAIAGGYLLVARGRGLGTRVRPYVLTGIGLAVVLVAASVWTRQHPSSADAYPPLLARLIEPAGAIGLALLVLAWLERHVALALFTVVYLVVVLVPVTFGWGDDWGPGWRFAPRLVIQGSVLLLGAIGFGAARRWYR